MTTMTLSEVSEKMRDIDFAVLTSKSDGGALAGRPMSNNREVEFDGDAYFFTCSDTRTVSDIERDPRVGIGYQGKSGMMGMKPFFLTVEGEAELICDREQFEKHWTKDLDAWFKEGVDTPGLCLIKVRAQRVHYWDGYDEGELDLSREEALAQD